MQTDIAADHEWPVVDMSHRYAYHLRKDKDKNHVA